MNEYLMLELVAESCTAEALVNGIPVSRSTPGGYLQTQRPVHEFLMSTGNIIQLVVEPGPTPGKAEQARQIVSETGISARISFRSMPQGSYPEDPDVKNIASIDFHAPAGTSLPVPVVRQAQVDGFPWLPKLSWLANPPIRLTPEITERATKLLKDISTALSKGDPEPFISAAPVRFNEIAAAYEQSPEALKSKFRNQFKTVFTKPGFKMEPLDSQKLDLRLCGKNNIIDCLDTEWEPVLRAAKLDDGTTPIRYPVKLAFINNILQIVR